MRKIHLTSAQKIALELRHKHARDSRESDRIKAVLLRAEGWQIDWIAQALRRHESSIARYIDEYVESEKLEISSGGSESKLNEKQTQVLIEHLSDNTYHHQRDILVYIRETWGVIYTVSGINKWLHKNGFSYKKPKSMPYKADPQKQKAFIETYGQLKENLSKQDAIYFMDAVHPTQATKVCSGWIRTGTDKPIKTTGSRTRVNIVGAIQLERIANAITSQYKTVNGESIIDFMNILRVQSRVKGVIHLIVDGAGYHKAEVVTEKAKELNIKLHYLPPYSPNLNPIERLWKVMNEQVRNNICFHSAKEFREKINHFFEHILPDIGDSLKTRINDNFQLFDPALSS